MKTLSIHICIVLLFAEMAFSQEKMNHYLSLEDVLQIYSLESPAARIEQMTFQNELLNFENYKKSFLPTFSLSLNPIAFNRSLRLLQSPEDGSYSSIEDYSNSSSAGISINQKIGPTGGNINIGSNLSYLNEFSSSRNSFSTSPFFISYSQQLWGGRKLFLFEKRMQNANHLISIKKYCTKIAHIQSNVLELYFIVLSNRIEADLALRNQQMNDSLLHIAQIKLSNGQITEYDYKQIELQTFDIQYTYHHSLKQEEEAVLNLKTNLDLKMDSITVYPPKFNLPIMIDHQEVKYYVTQNNPSLIEQQINMLKAETELFSTQMGTRFNGNISLNYGINQYAETFTAAYRHGNTQQSVTIGFQIPAWQWGINRNKRKIAWNNYQLRKLEIENSIHKFQDEIYTITNNYNHYICLWQLSEKAYLISQDQYNVAVKSFILGHISIYELTAALQKQHEIMLKYFSSMKNAYISYFQLRSMALYDFEKKRNLEDIYI